MLPAIGAVVAGVGVGRALRLRTGKRGFFLIALGTSLALAAVIAQWRAGTPWWLLLGGIVVVAVGLSRLRASPGPR
jgi:phosphoglycerol transferase MdoB-like AlkP superfamily enzyme